jgi:hypothetical protein
METGNTKRAATDATQPTYFGMKFIAVYLAEDVDNVTYSNIGIFKQILF